MSSNISQNYPYGSETEAERAAAVERAVAAFDGLRERSRPSRRRSASRTTAGAGGSGSAPRTTSRADSTWPVTRSSGMPSTPSATPAAEASSAEPGRAVAGAARRRLILDAAGLSVSAIAFGLVYGLAARTADFSLIEMLAMSAFVLAGAAQFAAIGLVAGGVPWRPSCS